MSEGSATRGERPDEHGLREEIAMLRQLMRRLMSEEAMARLVAGVTRLSTAPVQVVRIERSIAERPDDRMNEAINRAWTKRERQEALGVGARENA